MSYILDALRKAERERNAGQSAPLEIVTHGGAPQVVVRRPRWPWALAGATGAVAIAALVALLVLRKPAADAPAPAAAPVAEEADTFVPEDEDLAMLPADDVIPEDELTFDETAELDSLDQVAGTPPRSAPMRPFDAGVDGVEEELLEEPVEEMAPEQEFVEEVPPEEPIDESGEPIVESFDYAEPPQAQDEYAEPEPESAPAATRTAPAPPAAPPPQPRTQVDTLRLDPAPGQPPKLLKEMPSAYRADFPRLTVEVHVYDARAAKRWVIINSRRYREGDTLVEGPRIAAVVRDGIVFEFRGERVLYPR